MNEVKDGKATKMDFTERNVRKALDAEGETAAYALSRAFVWEEHPRGQEFWKSQFDALERGGMLSVEARADLEALLPTTTQGD